MKTLTKLCTLLAITLSLNLVAQSTVQTAFNTSYERESKGDYIGSIKILTDSYDATSYFMNYRLGWLNYANKNYDESIKYYQKATNLLPNSTEVLWAILNPLVAKANWTEVDKTYSEILKLDPKNSVANYQVGLNYYYRKNYNEAKKYFDVALSLYPYDYSTALMSAWNTYFLGNKTEAINLFNRVLTMYPTDASALEGIGLCKK